MRRNKGEGEVLLLVGLGSSLGRLAVKPNRDESCCGSAESDIRPQKFFIVPILLVCCSEKEEDVWWWDKIKR
jgi:hypothetical protein